MEWIVIIGIIIFALGFLKGKSNSNSTDTNQQQKNSLMRKYSGLINCITSDLAYCLVIRQINSNSIILDKQLVAGGYVEVKISEISHGIRVDIKRENKGKTCDSTLEFNEFEKQHLMYDKISIEFKILYFMLEGCTREHAEKLVKLK